MNRWARAAGLISPRTGMPLRVTPRRFRYTLATEMAREGASRHKIAEVLDHTDLQNVEVYIEASSYIVTQVGERFDPRFQPVLQRFLGKVVDGSDPQPFPGVKRKMIPGVVLQLPMAPLNLGGIGACGRDAEKEGICQLAPPLSCYGCDKFAAFRDFDHGSIGDALEHVIATRLDGQADERISHQLVGTLHAVRQVQHQRPNLECARARDSTAPTNERFRLLHARWQPQRAAATRLCRRTQGGVPGGPWVKEPPAHSGQRCTAALGGHPRPLARWIGSLRLERRRRGRLPRGRTANARALGTRNHPP